MQNITLNTAGSKIKSEAELKKAHKSLQAIVNKMSPDQIDILGQLANKLTISERKGLFDMAKTAYNL